MHLVTRECITSIHGTSCLLMYNQLYSNIAAYVSMRIFEFIIHDLLENKKYLKTDMPEILFS